MVEGGDVPAIALPPIGIALICATDHRRVPSEFVRLLSQRLKSAWVCMWCEMISISIAKGAGKMWERRN